MAHILLVDDSGVSRDVVAQYLTRNGFEVATATDGRDGLKRLREDPGIRLVVSDMNMPVMDGLTMAEKVRCELGNQDVRIVMLTGHPRWWCRRHSDGRPDADPGRSERSQGHSGSPVRPPHRHAHHRKQPETARTRQGRRRERLDRQALQG